MTELMKRMIIRAKCAYSPKVSSDFITKCAVELDSFNALYVTTNLRDEFIIQKGHETVDFSGNIYEVISCDRTGLCVWNKRNDLHDMLKRMFSAIEMYGVRIENAYGESVA